MTLEIDINHYRGLPQKQLLMIFTHTFNFIIAHNHNYRIFSKGMPIYCDIFNACIYTSLCLFLYNSKRIGGSSLRKFIYTHSPLNYDQQYTRNYFDYKSTNKYSIYSDKILSEEDRLRQYRKRLLENRPVYDKNTEWAAIRKSSEYEWSLYYVIDDADIDIQETFKRLRTLYNPLTNLNDKNTPQSVFDKFMSKLNKIKYENILKLDKFILDYIQENKEFYPINLYRLEKELRVYNIMSEIDQLLTCQNEIEEITVLKKFRIVGNIFFPKLHEYWVNFENINDIHFHTNTFSTFLNELVISILLILDRFIDDKILDEEWKELFLNTLYSMTEDVFYNPQKIDYTVKKGSQEKFIKLLSSPVYSLLFES